MSKTNLKQMYVDELRDYAIRDLDLLVPGMEVIKAHVSIS